MKILQVIPTLNVGGAETMMCNLSCELAKMNHEVIVVSFYKMSSSIVTKLYENNIKVIFLEKRAGFDISILFKLKKIIKEENPDILHTHLHVLPYVWITSGNIRIVHTLHTIASKEQSGIGKKICEFIYKFSSKCIPVAISKNVKNSFDNEYHENFSMRIIENGVPIEKIIPKSDYMLKERINCIHVGSFSKVKNHEIMIRSIKKLVDKNYDINLNFYGTGELLDNIEKMVSEYQLEENIIFKGISSNIYTILNKYDIFMLPSKYEGVPMSLLEAMSAGLPCIASNVGGTKDIISSNKDGILINPCMEELTEAIEKLIIDNSFRERIGRNAIIKSRSYSSEVMAQKYIEVYTNEKME